MTLATSIFGLSLAANVYLLIISGLLGGGGSGTRHNVITEGDISQTVAVIPIAGIIDEASFARFEKTVKQIKDDSNIKALVVELDTPGGSVTASDEVYQLILQLKKEKGIKVVAAMRSVAASGGYYIACAADHIVAQRTTITGSIGVMMPRYNFAKLADEWGIEDKSLHSTGADFKTLGSPFKPTEPQEDAYFLNIIDQAFVTFKSVITTGRQGKLTQPIDQIANGKIYTAAEALKLGLVDQEGYSSDAYAVASQGLTKPHVVRYEATLTLLDIMGAESRAGSAKGTTINGVNVNLDHNLIHQLVTPQLMYLWRGQ